MLMSFADQMDQITHLYEIALDSGLYESRARLMRRYVGELTNAGFTRDEALDLLKTEIRAGNFQFEVNT